MSIFIQMNSNEILTLNQFAGQKTDRKHTEYIVGEINTALYNRENREIFDSLDSISRVLIDVLKRDKYPGHIIFYPKHSCCK